MRRIVIVGNSGTGKSTLARELAGDLGLTHIEMDGLFHQADWTPTPADQFQRKLRDAMDAADRATDGWSMCGNYSSVTGGIQVRAADTIVWLDMPRWLIMKRVTSRTVRRTIAREELWNGNREPLTNFYKWDPEENIIRWAWTQFDHYREQFSTSMADGTWDHAQVFHLRSPTEVTRFKAAV